MSPDYGGKGLPQTVSMVFDEMVCSTNLAFGVYPLLSNGAAAVIELHAMETLKQAYLPQLADGTWSGTMCLTESHCGTDLGLIRTKAVPKGDGRYAISGTKIFISAGEHDLTENIVHLVLAKLPDAPPGVRGISLFLVPKRTLKEDGTAGPANGVSCGSIEEKMGIHGSATCVMHFDEAEGYLIGKPHKGLRCMFTMMNGARLGVGLQGLGLGETAYQSADGLRQGPPPGARAQGRRRAGGIRRPHHRPPGRAPHASYPACRQRGRPCARLLDGAAARRLAQPRGCLGARGRGRAGAAHDAHHQGLLHRLRLRGHQPRAPGARRPRLHPRARHGAARARRADQPDLRGRERHPGARPGGAQAAAAAPAATCATSSHPAVAFMEENKDDPELADIVGPVGKALGKLQTATLVIAQRGLGDPEEAGAAASDYLRMFGLVAVGYMWCQMAKLARNKQNGDAFYDTKLKTARFYVQKVLPDTAGLFLKIMAGKGTVMAHGAEEF